MPTNRSTDARIDTETDNDNGWVRVADRLPQITHDASGGVNHVLALWKPGKLADNLCNPNVTNTVYLHRNADDFSHWRDIPALPLDAPVKNKTAPAQGTPPDGEYAPQRYPLPDELYESKDWRASNYAGRVEWLHLMYDSVKRELDQLYEHIASGIIPQPAQPKK